jgi:hypothetical protein
VKYEVKGLGLRLPRPLQRPALRRQPVFDFRAYLCQSAIDAHAFGFRLRAEAPEDKKAIFDQYQSAGVMPEGEPA